MLNLYFSTQANFNRIISRRIAAIASSPTPICSSQLGSSDGVGGMVVDHREWKGGNVEMGREDYV